MGAREKLNAVCFTGCLIVAGLVGLAFQSWTAFLIALIAGLAIKAHDGGIRLAGGKRSQRRFGR